MKFNIKKETLVSVGAGVLTVAAALLKNKAEANEKAAEKEKLMAEIMEMVNSKQD